MTSDEALAFLQRHQPLPPDDRLDQETLDRYDEVRRFYLDNYDERCVRPLLNSFGDGSGFGVYQLIEDVIRRYPKSQVVDALSDSLQSSHDGVRYWSLQVAMYYPEPVLIPHFVRMLSSANVDERVLAAQNLRDTPGNPDQAALRKAYERETDTEVRAIINEILTGNQP